MHKILKRSQVIKTASETAIKVVTKQNPTQIGGWLAQRFQTLGPTYIKIGQFISSRKDIFGTEFAICFDILRDQVTPISYNQVQPLISVLDSKLSIDPKPIASASIGQVHKAQGRKSGRDFIVKIKRPAIQETIHDDLEFLKTVVQTMIAFKLPNAQNTLTMLKEFEEYFLQEIDFTLEAQNLELFHDTYSQLKDTVKIPYLVKSLCSSNVLVMEYVNDVGIDNFHGDRKYTARLLMNFFIQQLTDYGVIHGDPHRGNIGITPEGQIILYDFGSIITFNREERFFLKELIYMLIVGNKAGIMKLLTKLGVEIVDKEAIVLYIDKYMEYMRTIDINVFRNIQTENFELPLKLNGKVFRLLRVYGILEGICKELDPDFNYFDLLDNYITSLALDEEFIMYKVQQDLETMQGSFGKAIFDFFDVK